ncbi:hypothetical protein GOB93_11225 [Acetobacter musti]|uniref:Lipoprotein n=1 Tax=Acetobacter musti TaxID=864732 RepID=A0ABX0JUJ9_9PROT|nr:hypothetical protein [Acetobacter musti]NHN85209.1 hypothetical protein [Acetobacter musti]
MPKVFTLCLLIGAMTVLSACSGRHYHHRMHDGSGWGGPGQAHYMNSPSNPGWQYRGGRGPMGPVPE